MAHHRLGQEALARLAYQSGIEWMEADESRSRDEDLRRLRAEAEVTLGIGDQ